MYSTDLKNVRYTVFDTKEALCQALGELVLQCTQQAQQENKVFRLALSGGSLPELLGKALVPHQSNLQTCQWQAFLADERCVPETDELSNGYQLESWVFKPLSFTQPSFQFYRMSQEKDPILCAEKYQILLKDVFSSTSSLGTTSTTSNPETIAFDLILLGMGPDGHTCSLFPNHPLVTQMLPGSMKLVAPIFDSPKPPKERITLTLPVLNQAKLICFVCTGAAKKEVIECILHQPDKAKKMYPAALVQPNQGQVVWFLDKDAGANLVKKE